MLFEIFQTLLPHVFVCVLAFDDIFVDGNLSHDMIERGRTEYQLLREKGNLPRYGACWKGALEYVEEGCRNLSEDTQSDMSLHITNCFLEMSGHETYNCELNKKENLRRICIFSMTDRAFNVYTEFYTHVQNICWFLRGQVWYETISENSFKVGKQLEESARNQEDLLKSQQESIKVQEQILRQEKVLHEILDDLSVTAKAHKEILNILTRNLVNFHSWVIGEISWVDSILYYFICGFFILIFTSVKHTTNARLTLLLLLFTNLIFERFICYILISENALFSIKNLSNDIYSYVWYCRTFFIVIFIVYFFYYLYSYKDLSLKSYESLQTIFKLNLQIVGMLQALNNNSVTPNNDSFNVINESHSNKDFDETSNCSTFSRIKSRQANLKFGSERYYLRSSKQNTPDLL